MKTGTSSRAALLALLFALTPLSLPAQGFIERSVPSDSNEFSRMEKDTAKNNPGYFTINPGSIKLVLLGIREEADMSYVRLQEEPSKELNSILVAIDSIVNVASKIWQIVEKNAPVAEINTKYATAYPYGITSAAQLSQWTRPKTYSYALYAENLYGGVMIDAKYNLSFSYDGSYNGKGKYLTGVAVIPSSTNVAWGYKFYMSAAVPDSTITNVGTHEDPVAAMQMRLAWRMATALKEVAGTSVYYVEGGGYFEEIASPWKKQAKAEDVKAAAPLFDPEKIF